MLASACYMTPTPMSAPSCWRLLSILSKALYEMLFTFITMRTTAARRLRPQRGTRSLGGPNSIDLRRVRRWYPEGLGGRRSTPATLYARSSKSVPRGLTRNSLMFSLTLFGDCSGDILTFRRTYRRRGEHGIFRHATYA